MKCRSILALLLVGVGVLAQGDKFELNPVWVLRVDNNGLWIIV